MSTLSGFLLPLLLLLLIASSYQSAAQCTEKEAIEYIEKTLQVDVLYLTGHKNSRCKAKIAGMERYLKFYVVL
jgi:hypothetical protein